MKRQMYRVIACLTLCALLAGAVPPASAGQIAEHFHMSPSGLSQIYKRDTGRGILDDIHYCRVQHAKELLAQNMTIQNAASLSGYYHTRPMVEAFKRIEGVTPSEYRRKHSG